MMGLRGPAWKLQGREGELVGRPIWAEEGRGEGRRASSATVVLMARRLFLGAAPLRARLQGDSGRGEVQSGRGLRL